MERTGRCIVFSGSSLRWRCPTAMKGAVRRGDIERLGTNTRRHIGGRLPMRVTLS